MKLFLILFLSAVTAQASKVRDGGELKGLYKKSIKKYIEKELKNHLLAMTAWLRPGDIPDSEVQDMVKAMIEGNIKKDIKESPYVFASDLPEKSCINENGEKKAAVSTRLDFGGAICFDLDKLSETNGTSASVAALAMHEHAHHFGFEDKDEKLTKYFTYLIDISSRNSQFAKDRALQEVKQKIAPFAPKYGAASAAFIGSLSSSDDHARRQSAYFLIELTKHYDVISIEPTSFRKLHRELTKELAQYYDVELDRLALFIFNKLYLVPK